jgi:uncharacterized membrane protein YccC
VSKSSAALPPFSGVDVALLVAVLIGLGFGLESGVWALVAVA